MDIVQDIKYKTVIYIRKYSHFIYYMHILNPLASNNQSDSY